MIYDLPELKRNRTKLALSVQGLVGIYNGTIKFWDHPSILTSNPGVSLPHKRIRVVARGDNAGDTEIFTSALSLIDPKWEATFGHFINPGNVQQLRFSFYFLYRLCIMYIYLRIG